jgi:hypothetical protein
MVRLVCNRDERRSRPAALPPQVRQFGQWAAVLPLDPTSAGTWVAVNDAGLIMTLLNVHADRKEEETQAPLHSRGTIIPGLLECGELSLAICEATRLDARRYAPFRLIVADRGAVAELRSNGNCVRVVCHGPIHTPLLFTSSGLGDYLVEEPRRRLFASIFGQPGDRAARQDEFHRHRWPEQPHLSVCMDRSDARTVSQTVISLGPDRATLTYHPDAPDQPAHPVSVTIPLVAGGVR